MSNAVAPVAPAHTPVSASVQAALDVWEDRADHVSTHVLTDGSVVVVYSDPGSVDTESPRDWDGNVATLINTSDRTVAVDTDDAGIGEARDRWAYGYGYGERQVDRTGMVARYVRMFRPDVVHYAPYWAAGRGDSHGWGYVTREAMTVAGYDADDMTDDRARELLEGEVKVYGQWCEGEVYAAAHLTLGDPVVVYGAHGAYVDGHHVIEETVHGFLGYDDDADIAASFGTVVP